MSKFIINGGKTLKGEIQVKGAKNSALKIIAASLLSQEKIKITNAPDIEEIKWLLELIKQIGAKVEQKEDVIIIQTKDITTVDLPCDLVRKTRSAVMLAGPILARKGKVSLPSPGGCALGKRPINFFLEGFKLMGAKVVENKDVFEISVKGGLKGCSYFFTKISHTATESLMMTACLAKGQTILKNAACEPEVKALADYLNICGAKIQGAGTPTIIIDGVKEISADVFETIPDRLETGTFAILGALCAKKLKITNCNPSHVEALWERFMKMGVDYELGEDYVIIKGMGDYKAVDLHTHEYPGFCTDIQAPFTVLLTQSNGISLVFETIFDGRLFYVDTLKQMGANIVMCDPHRVVVQGPSPLFGRNITSPDIRAGIAMVLAALKAKGQSTIDNIYQIDRGYEKIEERLKAIGADIKRVD